MFALHSLLFSFTDNSRQHDPSLRQRIEDLFDARRARTDHRIAVALLHRASMIASEVVMRESIRPHNIRRVTLRACGDWRIDTDPVFGDTQTALELSLTPLVALAADDPNGWRHRNDAQALVADLYTTALAATFLNRIDAQSAADPPFTNAEFAEGVIRTAFERIDRIRRAHTGCIEALARRIVDETVHKGCFIMRTIDVDCFLLDQPPGATHQTPTAEPAPKPRTSPHLRVVPPIKN